jgi:hypothetical protein
VTVRSVQVRGMLLNGVRRQAATRWGDDALLAAVAAHSGGVAKALRGVVDGAWYPVGWLACLDRAIVDTSGMPDAVREFARETSEVAFRRFAGGASVAPSLLRPREVLERSANLLVETFAGVRSRVVDDAQNVQHRRFDSEEPLPSLVWDHFRGGFAGVVEATGVGSVRVEDVIGGGDEPYLELRVSWR